MSDLVGTVIAVRPRLVFVRAGSEVFACDIPKTLLQGPRLERNLLAVGDHVEIEVRGGGRGVILERSPRRNKISRLGGVRPRREQVIAANVDQLIVLQSVATPRWNPRALDRLLIVGESGEVSCAVCLNKVDLLGSGPADAENMVGPYRRIGYPVFLTSAMTGAGVSELADYLRGRTTILLGQSGVGKSTLLNRLVPEAELATARVSMATGKGRHTTARTEYLTLPDGGAVLDTPGLRAIQPWVTSEELAGHFPEMRPLLGSCRFPDCSHRTEPGCAVRRALADGTIDSGRYDSYLRILAGLLAEE